MTPASAIASGYMPLVAGVLNTDAGILSSVASGATAFRSVAGALWCPGAGTTTGCLTNDGTTTSLNTLTSTIASGSNAFNMATGARLGLITGGADYISCDGTTCTLTGAKLSVISDDITTGGSLLAISANQSVAFGTGGLKHVANIVLSALAPTISSGFCSGAAFLTHNKGYGFRLDVGTSCAASTGVIGLAATADTGWICNAMNITSPATYVVQQTTTSTTAVTFTQYNRTTGIAANWVDSEDILVSCIAY